MYSTPVDLSFVYLRSAVEASLDTKKVQMEPNTYSEVFCYWYCFLILIPVRFRYLMFLAVMGSRKYFYRLRPRGAVIPNYGSRSGSGSSSYANIFAAFGLVF